MNSWDLAVTDDLESLDHLKVHLEDKLTLAYLLPSVQHAEFGALLPGVHQYIEHGAD